MEAASQIFSADFVRNAATDAGFELVGFARPDPIEDTFLRRWLAQRFHADMVWMEQRHDQRVDVQRLFPGVQTVVALANNYWHDDSPSLVARYARGRDYHATMKDRMRTLRRALKVARPTIRTYSSFDFQPVMEKVWAVRAGLGVVGKNGCLITPEFGSWVVLATIMFDCAVDSYAVPTGGDVCGRCRLCLDACPTGAIVDDAVVDASRCLSYQTIENVSDVPERLRVGFRDTVFGCDVCQEVCPHNAAPVRAGGRFSPRTFATKSAAEWLALDEHQYAAGVAGSPLARAGLTGLRRNAAYAVAATAAERAAMRPTVRSRLEWLSLHGTPLEQRAAAWALRTDDS